MFRLLCILLGLAIWIWALIALVNFWSKLPIWAQVIGILGLLMPAGGPIITLIVVYVAKNNHHR